MGKFDSLIKLLKSQGTKEIVPTAEGILSHIKTPEQMLTQEALGPARNEYLQALDEVHGPQAQRATDMGFSPKTYYHGTTGDITEFKNDPNAVTRRPFGENEPSHFFTDWQKEASDYARKKYTDNSVGGNVIPSYLKKDNILPNEYIPGMDQSKFDTSINNETIGNLPVEHVAVKNPEQIRSVNAAFDPRFKTSGNIAAGVAGAGALLTGSQSQASDKENNMEDNNDEDAKKAALQQMLQQKNAGINNQIFGTTHQFPDSGRTASNPGQVLDSYVGAPLRQTIGQAQQDPSGTAANLVRKFGSSIYNAGKNLGSGNIGGAVNQFIPEGMDPKNAPSWETLGKNVGIPESAGTLPLVGNVNPRAIYGETMGMVTDPLAYLNPSGIGVGAGVSKVEQAAIPRTMTTEQQKEILGELPEALKYKPELNYEVPTPEKSDQVLNTVKQRRLEKLRDILNKRQKDRAIHIDEPTEITSPTDE